MSLPSSNLSQPTLQGLALEAHVSQAIASQQRIQEFTQELFGSPADIRAESDCETDDRYFTVYVTTSAEPAEIVRLNDAWHRRLLQTAGDVANFYRLALDVR